MSRRKLKSLDYFSESLMNNDRAYIGYLSQLLELAMSCFQWTGVPDTVDIRFLETVLMNEGVAIFFRDEIIGELALQMTAQSGFNIYGYPVKRRAYAVNGYQRMCDDTDSVLIYNNYLRTNSINVVERYAAKLANLDRIIDVNSNAQKTPVVLQCRENQRLTLVNLFKEMDGNAPVIFADKNIDLNDVKSVRTDAPFVADKIFELKSNIWNEALTYLGVANVSLNKKERLITDEVNRSQGGVIAMRQSRLKSRQDACEKINKMFGLDMWVEFNTTNDVINMETEQDGGETYE